MDVVIENLLALGFKDSIHVTSFDASNVKLFEKVLYFLISQIDSSAISVWPILLKKDQIPFRKEVSKFFKALNDALFVATEVNALLLSPRGQKCHRFLAAFTQYVLEVKIRCLDPCWNEPALDTGTVAIVLQKMKLLTFYHENKILKSIGYYKKEDEILNAYYQELMRQYKKLSKNVATRVNKSKGMAKIDPNTLDEEMEKLSREVCELNSILAKMSNSSTNVSYTIQKKNDKQEPFCVNLQTLNVQMPSTLTSYLESQGAVHERGTKLFSTDTLDLLSLLSFSNLALELYKEQMNCTQKVDPDILYQEEYETQLKQLVEQLAQLKMTLDTELNLLTM